MTDQPFAAGGRASAPGARPGLILDIPLPPARGRATASTPAREGTGARAGTESPPARPPAPAAPGTVPPAPALRPAPAARPPAPAPAAPAPPAPAGGYEEPTIEWRQIRPRPAAPARAARPGRHLAIAGVGTGGIGLAGFLAGLVGTNAPFVVLGWACSGTIVLVAVVRLARWIGDAIGMGHK